MKFIAEQAGPAGSDWMASWLVYHRAKEMIGRAALNLVSTPLRMLPRGQSGMSGMLPFPAGDL